MVSVNDAAARLLPPLGRLRRQRDDLARALESAQHRAAEVEAGLRAEVEAARREAEDLQRRYEGSPGALYPPGHFYSPVPDLDVVRRDAGRIFREPDEVAGVDLRAQAQTALLESLAEHWPAWPYYDETARRGLRYDPDNDYFGHVDGLVLFGLLRELQPKRYVEVGSGWSSALVLDLRDSALPGLETTFIEPYPDRLQSLLRPEDEDRTDLVVAPVQDVDLAVFDRLEPGDVLFIDSTHVSKIGSDVNHLFFDVLPHLPAGVHVHVHDIRYPFEYSPEWVFEGRAWNEAYLLRALLTGSAEWEIDLWVSYLQIKHAALLGRQLPPGARIDGASIWLRRTASGQPAAGRPTT